MVEEEPNSRLLGVYCAAFFPEIDRPKKGPISHWADSTPYPVLFAGVTSPKTNAIFRNVWEETPMETPSA
jgi:hypothetical protein